MLQTELLLRKLFACLGIPWSSSYDETHINEEIEKEEDYESNTPLQVSRLTWFSGVLLPRFDTSAAESV